MWSKKKKKMLWLVALLALLLTIIQAFVFCSGIQNMFVSVNKLWCHNTASSSEGSCTCFVIWRTTHLLKKVESQLLHMMDLPSVIWKKKKGRLFRYPHRRILNKRFIRILKPWCCVYIRLNYHFASAYSYVPIYQLISQYIQWYLGSQT